MTKDEVFSKVKKEIGFGDETSRRMFDDWCKDLEEEGVDVTSDVILKKIDEFYVDLVERDFEDESDEIAYGKGM